MRLLDRVVGGWLHARIVQVPGAHAELLNQYRSAEDFGKRFPKSVCDKLLDDGPLKAKYRKHQADEERHDRQYGSLIRRLGGEPRAVRAERDYLRMVWRTACAAGIGIPYARFAEARPLDRAERMRLWALQTAVEERGLAELALHRLATAHMPFVHETLDAIEPDERHHREYSVRALEDAGMETCMSVDEGGLTEAHALLAAMRSVEDRAYRAVTGAFLSDLVAGPLARAGVTTRVPIKAIAATLPSSPSGDTFGWD